MLGGHLERRGGIPVDQYAAEQIPGGLGSRRGVRLAAAVRVKCFALVTTKPDLNWRDFEH
jgi:hypothetical protein